MAKESKILEGVFEVVAERFSPLSQTSFHHKDEATPIISDLTGRLSRARGAATALASRLRQARQNIMALEARLAAVRDAHFHRL